MTKANDSGGATVEVALSLFAFLLFILGTINFAILYSTELTLQNAVRQAGRYAITGQCIGSGGTCSETRYNSIVTTLENASLGLLNTNNITITCTNEGGGCPNNAGGPGDIVTITATYPYNFLIIPMAHLTNNSYTITVSSSFKNEPFPPSES